MHELLLDGLESQLRNHIVALGMECRLRLSMRRSEISSSPRGVHAPVVLHRASASGSPSQNVPAGRIGRAERSGGTAFGRNRKGHTEPLLPPIRGVVMGKGVVMGVRGVITTPLEAFNPLERVYGG